ncbi:MAG TPA: hypothetical protein V6C82_09060 [Chroococcales cyanobacterium]
MFEMFPKLFGRDEKLGAISPEQLKEVLQSIETKYTALQEENHDLYAKLQEAGTRIEAYEATKPQTTSKPKRNFDRQLIDTLKAQRTKMARSQALEEEKNDLERKNDLLEGEKIGLEQKKEDLERKTHLLEEEKIDLEKKNNLLEEEKTEFTQRLEENAARIAELLKKPKANTGRLQSLEEEKKGLEVQVEESAARIAELEERNLQNMQDFESAAPWQELENLRNQLEEMGEKHEQLGREHDKLLEENQSLQEQREGLESEVERLISRPLDQDVRMASPPDLSQRRELLSKMIRASHA